MIMSCGVANVDKQDADTSALRALNEKIVNNVRVELVMLPIGDTLTMARKI